MIFWYAIVFGYTSWLNCYLLRFMDFMLGILLGKPIYTQIPLEFRLCILCDSNMVEDENHFLFQSYFYHTLKDQLFSKC